MSMYLDLECIVLPHGCCLQRLGHRCSPSSTAKEGKEAGARLRKRIHALLVDVGKRLVMEVLCPVQRDPISESNPYAAALPSSPVVDLRVTSPAVDVDLDGPPADAFLEQRVRQVVGAVQDKQGVGRRTRAYLPLQLVQEIQFEVGGVDVPAVDVANTGREQLWKRKGGAA